MKSKESVVVVKDNCNRDSNKKDKKEGIEKEKQLDNNKPLFHTGKVLKPKKTIQSKKSNGSGGYWQKRTEKLIQQNKENVLNKFIYPQVLGSKENQLINPIFRGLTFYFNSIRGVGIESQFHLSKLASTYGAVVLPNPSKKRNLTHIIASNLPNRKVEQIESKKELSNVKVKYVSPKWVLDCVSNKKLLSETPYLITKLDSSQQILDSFISVDKRECR
ncbi:hypothetical protein ABK040_006048 [Willaertia magna]